MEPQIIKSKLDELPEDLRKEVYDFMEFLLQNTARPRQKKENSNSIGRAAYQI